LPESDRLMRRLCVLLVCLCLFLAACGGNGAAGNATQPSANVTAAAQLIATATATPEPTVKPTATATATPKPPTATATRPRPTLTPTVVLTVAPTATVPRPALPTVGIDASGKCQIGLPEGFVPIPDAPDTWRSADRFITISLVVPDSSTNPTLPAVTASSVTGLQQRVSEFKEVTQVKGAGSRRVNFTGKSGDQRAWGSLYVRQFGLDYCQVTVMATAGTTILLDPLTGSLAALKPRPAPLAYLALGDSYAAGVGATDPQAGGYVPRFLDLLNEQGATPIGVKNLAVSGATSVDFLGDWSTKGAEGTSPLAGAVKALNAGGISVVTIDIGGNDILRLLKPGQACAGSAIEGEPCLTAMREALKTTTTPNLPIIFGALVEAAQPGTQILVINYPNAFSTGQGTVAETRAGLGITELNALIAATIGNLQAPASGRGVTLTTVDIAPLFAGQGGKLTHILDPTPDIHPTDAGHTVIAEALLKAYKR
jgi:lysophospholipase L1-like esterase